MGGSCARCGEDPGEGRWCQACGLDSTPTAATLPTAEAMEAGNRERAWFSSRPEQAAEEERLREAAIARTKEAEEKRLASARPAGLDAYRDVSWRARLARGWLVIVAALTLLGATLEIGHLKLIAGKTASDLDFAFAQRVDDSNATVGIVYIVTFCAYLFSAAFFAAWTYRAYKNITALGAQRPRFGPGWAIGGWFVPILGLWRPKQIVDDIWRSSDPAAPAVMPPDRWHGLRTPALLAWWWLFYIAGSVADRLSARQPSDTIEHDRLATTYALAASILTIIAAGLAFLVVTRVTARQRARADALRALPAAPVSDSPRTAATAPAT
jgi:hypothetical protein